MDRSDKVTSDTDSGEEVGRMDDHARERLSRREMLGRAAAVGASAAFPAFLTGATRASAASESAQTFLVLTRNQPNNIDPAVGADNPTRKIHVGVYEPLIAHKLGTADFDHLQGVLAESWKVSADHMHYSFTLRKGVKFHNGSTLSADDVKVTMDRMKKIGLGRSWVLDPVKEVRAVNAQTVDIMLSRPYPPFLLGLPLIYITSAKAVSTNQKGDDLAQPWYTRHGVGTGPYMLTDFRAGEQIVMDKFPAYWGKWEGKHIDHIVLKLVEESATQRVMMEGGQGHWADNISPADLQSLRTNKAFHVTSEPTWADFFLMMNTNKPPLDDARVRQALRYAFPYEPMLREVMHGRGAVAHGYLPPGFLMHDDSPAERTDLEQARGLIAAARVPRGTEVTLEYFAGFDWERQASELLAANLQPMGITLKIQGSPFPTMLQHITNPSQRWHMFFSSADPDTADPDSLLYRTFHSGSRHWSNFGFGDARLDNLLERARYELNPTRRRELYLQCQAMLQEQSPAINTLIGTSNQLLRSNVKGYIFHPPYGFGAIDYYSLSIE